MSFAARALLPCEESLPDAFARMSTFEVRRAIQELKLRLRAEGLDREIAGHIHGLLGCADARLGDLKGALEKFEIATRYNPDPALLSNHAFTLILLDRPQEAIPLLLRASKLPGGRTQGVLANFAGALARLGFDEEARRVFSEVEDLADRSSPLDLRKLALHAADLGLDDAAVDYFVRYLRIAHGDESTPELELLARHREEILGLPPFTASLSNVLRRTLSFGEALQDAPDEGEGSEQGDDDVEVYERGRGSRLRANTTVLRGNGDA